MQTQRRQERSSYEAIPDNDSQSKACTSAKSPHGAAKHAFGRSNPLSAWSILQPRSLSPWLFSNAQKSKDADLAKSGDGLRGDGLELKPQKADASQSTAGSSIHNSSNSRRGEEPSPSSSSSLQPEQPSKSQDLHIAEETRPEPQNGAECKIWLPSTAGELCRWKGEVQRDIMRKWRASAAIFTSGNLLNRKLIPDVFAEY